MTSCQHERSKRPSYQWYPGDARRDTALQACCLEARGLWREMLDLMHDGEPYGFLTAGGVPIGDAQLGRMVGITPRRCTVLLAELESRGVFSRTEEGVIYSRRMVRDGRAYAEWAAKSRRGGDVSAAKRATKGQPPAQPKAQPPAEPNGNTATATAFASAVQSVEAAALAFAVAANQGLAEHPSRPQAIPRVIATNGTTHTATQELLDAGVPVEFARSAIYDLAQKHNAQGEVASLKYFVAAVKRRWDQRQAKAAADSTGRPEKQGNNGAGEAFERALTLVRQFAPQNQPADLVRALYDDARVKAGLKAVGGLPAIRDCKPDKLVWLKKDFVEAYSRGAA